MFFQSNIRPIFTALLWLGWFNFGFSQTDEQQIQVDLRIIGHEFLMQFEDSTSRILPIEKIDGRFAIKFERNFAFEPNLLVSATTKVMHNSALDIAYLVEVEQCETHELVYSFRANPKNSKELRSCQQRGLSEDCYIFYFTVIEPIVTEIEEESSADLLPKEDEDESNGNFFFYILIPIVGFILLLGLFYSKGRPKKQPTIHQDLIQIGRFQFDRKQMLLSNGSESTELSGKESDLLYLLCCNENNTIERETILRVVWGDEGDYVGRTLDVFISKLRKKLEADPNLKIVNIRGVGYRFLNKDEA